MKKYLLSNSGKFYKANLHCHTNLSDGVASPEQIKKIYLDHGYSIVAFTDHDLFITHNDLTDNKFLALNGYEWEIYEAPHVVGRGDTRSMHACIISPTPDYNVPVCLHREKYYIQGSAYVNRVKNNIDKAQPDFEREYTPECVNTFFAAAREKGFFVTYNHPTSNGETYNEYIKYTGMHAMEIYNHACYTGGFDEYNPRVFDDFLRAGKKIYCIAADDNHNKTQDFCGGFVMIKAEKLEYNSVMNALFNGDFYASNGAQIKELYVENDTVTITTSPASLIIMNCGTRRTKCCRPEGDKPLTQAQFKIQPCDKYVRFTVRGNDGTFANTNAFFVNDILK